MLQPPQKGDVVRAYGWLGEVVTIRVDKTFDSPAFGPCFDGLQYEESTLNSRKREPVAYRYTALPLSHLILPAKLASYGRGKWEITYPDASTGTFPSKKSALDDIKERGLVLEV